MVINEPEINGEGMISFDDIVFCNDDILVEDYTTPFNSITKDVAFGTVVKVSFQLDFPIAGNVIMYRTEGRINIRVNNTSYYIIKLNSISIKYTSV